MLHTPPARAPRLQLQSPPRQQQPAAPRRLDGDQRVLDVVEPEPECEAEPESRVLTHVRPGSHVRKLGPSASYQERPRTSRPPTSALTDDALSPSTHGAVESSHTSRMVDDAITGARQESQASAAVRSARVRRMPSASAADSALSFDAIRANLYADPMANPTRRVAPPDPVGRQSTRRGLLWRR
jgi:hypothetical protein